MAFRWFCIFLLICLCVPTASGGRNTVDCLPDVGQGDFEPDSVFGLAFNKHAHPGLTVGAVKWLRFDFDFGPDFEGEGKAFDEAVARAEANKIMVLGILNTRGLAGAYANGTEPLATWIEWVSKVVSRYKGRVKYWEICNEPNNWKMPEVYVTMAKAAYVAGKQADPGCFLGAFSSFVELPFFEFCLKAGLADYFDFVTIHPYQWSHSFNDGVLLNDIESLEKLLTRYGGNRPIWISEIGWPTHPKGGSTDAVQGAIAGQLFCTMAGLAKYKTFWYTLSDWQAEPTDAEGYFGLFDGGRRMKPAFYSYYVTSKWLSRARGLGRAKVPAGCLGWRYVLADGRMGISIWRPAGPASRAPVELPGCTGPQSEMRTMDLERKMLNVKNARVELEIGPNPVLVAYPTTVMFDLPPKAPLVKIPNSTNPVFLTYSKPPEFFPGQTATVSFGVVNLTDNAAPRKVLCELSKQWGPAIRKELMTKVGRETRGEFEIKVPSLAKNGRYRLVLKSAGCRDLEVAVEVGSRLEVDILPIGREVGDKGIPLEFVLRNPSRERLSEVLTLTAAKGTVRPDPRIEINLDAGKEFRVMKTLDEFSPWIEFRGDLGGQHLAFQRGVDSTCIPRVKGEIRIDGDLKEWESDPPYRLNRIEQVQQIKSWWSGVEDLSGDVRFQWDERYLYFCADVIDDIHCQRSTGGSTWLGDGFQISFGAEGKYAYEFCLALTNEGPQLYSLWTITGETGFVQGAKVAAKREGKHTRYEAAIPWAAIPPLRPAAGKDVRLNFILNENDGTTREGYLECRPGIGSGKSIRGWYDWRLGENEHRREEKSSRVVK